MPTFISWYFRRRSSASGSGRAFPAGAEAGGLGAAVGVADSGSGGFVTGGIATLGAASAASLVGFLVNSAISCSSRRARASR